MGVRVVDDVVDVSNDIGGGIGVGVVEDFDVEEGGVFGDIVGGRIDGIGNVSVVVIIVGVVVLVGDKLESMVIEVLRFEVLVGIYW